MYIPSITTLTILSPVAALGAFAGSWLGYKMAHYCKEQREDLLLNENPSKVLALALKSVEVASLVFAHSFAAITIGSLAITGAVLGTCTGTILGVIGGAAFAALVIGVMKGMVRSSNRAEES